MGTSNMVPDFVIINVDVLVSNYGISIFCGLAFTVGLFFKSFHLIQVTRTNNSPVYSITVSSVKLWDVKIIIDDALVSNPGFSVFPYYL